MSRHLIATRSTLYLASERQEGVDALVRIPLTDVAILRGEESQAPKDNGLSSPVASSALGKAGSFLSRPGTFLYAQDGASSQTGDEPDRTLTIETSTDGHSAGRRFILRTTTAQDREDLEVAVGRLVREAVLRNSPTPSLTSRLRTGALRIYNRKEVRGLIAVLIFGSFVSDALEAQMLPKAADRLALLEEEEIFAREQTFKALEIIFTILFSVELAWNMIGNG
jgi:hypothetical protein